MWKEKKQNRTKKHEKNADKRKTRPTAVLVNSVAPPADADGAAVAAAEQR